MEVQIAFKHMDASDALRTHTEEKSQKLKKFFGGRITLQWSVDGNHGRFSAHCHLTGDHMNYFGEAEASDAYVAVDEVISKLERQLQKHKEIVTDHKHA